MILVGKPVASHYVYAIKLSVRSAILTGSSDIFLTYTG